MRVILTLVLISSSCLGQAKISGASRAGGASRVGASLTDPTPPMGWNSWLTTCGTCYAGGAVTPITEATVKAQSDLLVSLGFTGLGYTLVSIDDTWNDYGGVGGTIEGIPAQFPDGMAAVGTYIHSAGQRFGLYGAPGTTTCGGYPAQFGKETPTAVTMASWGLDYWKYDWCTDAPTKWGSTSAGGQNAFQTMTTALQQTGRRVSVLVNYAATFSPSWFAVVGATSVRIGEDNAGGTWYSKFTSSLSFATPYQTRGRWLDFDVLMGNLSENYNHGGPSAVSDAEAKAQFNAYAIAAAPLIIGANLSTLDSTNLTTYANSEVIAVDQDALGKMGSLTGSTTCGATVCQVWTRLLANGDYAIALINFDPSNTHTVSVLWSDFGQSGTFNIRDLWTHSSAGSSSTGYSVSLPGWGSAMVRISR